jgi:hypothetical protein
MPYFTDVEIFGFEISLARQRQTLDRKRLVLKQKRALDDAIGVWDGVQTSIQ